MFRVYTGVCSIKRLYHRCSPEREIIHSLKLVDYLHIQTDNYSIATVCMKVLTHYKKHTRKIKPKRGGSCHPVGVNRLSSSILENT